MIVHAHAESIIDRLVVSLKVRFNPGYIATSNKSWSSSMRTSGIVAVTGEGLRSPSGCATTSSASNDDSTTHADARCMSLG